MQKRSALTAALSGAPAPAVPPAPAAAGGTTHLDPQAFPCIAYADVVDGKLEDIVEALGDLDLSSIAIVGSAPTSVLMNGVTLVSCTGPHACHLQPPCPPADLRELHPPSHNACFLPAIVLQADYPLNPRRRRGGQETTPDVAASLVSQVGRLAAPRQRNAPGCQDRAGPAPSKQAAH